MLPVDFRRASDAEKTSCCQIIEAQSRVCSACDGDCAETEEAPRDDESETSGSPRCRSTERHASSTKPSAGCERLLQCARASSGRGGAEFFRDTKGSVSWSLRDLSQTLNISREEAERVVALLQMQGYVQPEAHKSGEWITTPSGETVSGAKTPRFDRATVEAALTSLKQRIEETNKDRAAKFQITRAVAFGDFLAKDRARVQAADVGIDAAQRSQARALTRSLCRIPPVEAREEQEFLRQLRGRSALINLKMYSEWMGTRTHQKAFLSLATQLQEHDHA